MKSKFSFILIGVIVLVVAVLAYFFVFKKPADETPATGNAGLVSTNTGQAQGLQNQNPTTTTGTAQTGSQVVQILRNLSIIQLDDSVFRNPAFAYLSDITVTLPPATTSGRRNPFGPITAADTAPAATTTTGATPLFPTM